MCFPFIEKGLNMEHVMVPKNYVTLFIQRKAMAKDILTTQNGNTRYKKHNDKPVIIRMASSHPPKKLFSYLLFLCVHIFLSIFQKHIL